MSFKLGSSIKAFFTSLFRFRSLGGSFRSKPKEGETETKNDKQKLPPNGEELDEQVLLEAFKAYDLNGDNVIQKGELKNVLTSYYKTAPTEKQLGKIMSKVDLNEDGVIEFSEFRKMMQERNTTKNDVRKNFEEFDVNKDGYITIDELTKILNAVEVHSEEEILEILQVADLDKDGKINFEEFMKFFK